MSTARNQLDSIIGSSSPARARLRRRPVEQQVAEREEEVRRFAPAAASRPRPAPSPPRSGASFFSVNSRRNTRSWRQPACASAADMRLRVARRGGGVVGRAPRSPCPAGTADRRRPGRACSASRSSCSVAALLVRHLRRQVAVVPHRSARRCRGSADSRLFVHAPGVAHAARQQRAAASSAPSASARAPSSIRLSTRTRPMRSRRACRAQAASASPPARSIRRHPAPGASRSRSVAECGIARGGEVVDARTQCTHPCAAAPRRARRCRRPSRCPAPTSRRPRAARCAGSVRCSAPRRGRSSPGQWDGMRTGLARPRYGPSDVRSRSAPARSRCSTDRAGALACDRFRRTAKNFPSSSAKPRSDNPRNAPEISGRGPVGRPKVEWRQRHGHKRFAGAGGAGRGDASRVAGRRGDRAA